MDQSTTTTIDRNGTILDALGLRRTAFELERAPHDARPSAALTARLAPGETIDDSDLG
jgi:hypothetical protein